MTDLVKLTAQLRQDEGVRACAYQDHLGYLTIGVGRLIDERKSGGLSAKEIDYLLANDIADRISGLQRALPWFAHLDDARQGVLINMAFQLGLGGLMGFANTLKLIERGDYRRAAEEMLRSKWASQTPARAWRLAKQMDTGQWQFISKTNVEGAT